MTLCLAGCWDMQILEDQAFIFAMAIDEAPESEHFYMGVTTPAFTEGAKELTTKGVVLTRSISQGLMNMQIQRERVLALGKISTVVFSTEVAGSDIMYRVLRQFDQQRDMNPNAWLVITEEISARDVLDLKPDEEERVAIYLDDMLNTGHQTGQIPKLTISHFWARHHAWGVCPIIPTIKKTESDSLMISGLAIIDHRGKVVGSFSDGETVMYMILTGEIIRGRFFTEVDYVNQKNRLVTSFIKKNGRKISTRIENNKPVIDIKMDIEVDVLNIDMTFDDHLTEEVFSGIQSALAKDLQGNLLKVIKIAQKSGADPFGFGQYVRTQNPKWSRNKDWGEEFAESTFNVQVKVTVKRIGTLINPSY